jgi:uncharacterized protein (TIGR03435 family)
MALAAAGLAQPAFDAASIKPSEEASGSSSGIATKPGRIEARNVTLRRCIRGAYDLPEAQIIGGPKWVDDVRYNIDAKASGPAGDHELMQMLQTLLAERFQLKIHLETRRLNGYALAVAKFGFRGKPLTESGDCNATASTGGPLSTITSRSCPMTNFASKLAECLHAPVLDTTGIDGKFDITLQWAPEEVRAKAGDAAAGLSLDDALLKTAGLRLTAQKVPIQIVIIDSAVPASGN